MADKVSIVILNWNQYGFTSECLRSLRKLTYPNYDVWIVDNASEDGSADRLLHEFPEIKLIRNSSNLGVAGGRNVGVKKVLERSPESGYILMLDNDTTVEPDLLEELAKVAHGDENIGIVTCKAVMYDDPSTINSAGIHFYPVIFHGKARGGGRADSGRWNEVMEVDATQGCVQFVRSSVFRKAGLYDVAFSPNGPEDWEFGLRAKKHGYRILYTPATTVFHKLSAEYKTTAKHIYNLARGYVVFMRKYCRWYQIWIAFLFFLAHRTARQIVPFLRNRDYPKVRACCAGIVHGLKAKIDVRPRHETRDLRPSSLMSQVSSPKSVVIIGPTPPPTHGLTIATERLLNSPLKDRFELIHLDTSDRRDISNMGRFDLINICLAVKSILGMAVYCLSKNPAIIYIPISQSNAGYLRDGLFIAVGKLLSDAKIVIHLHGGYFRTFYDQTNFLMKRFIDLTMKSCDRVIVLGHCLKWIFDKWFDEQCIDVVPTGTAVGPQLDGKFRRKDRYVITYLSNLLKTKGIVDTIESVEYVISKHENVKYKIAGSWSNKEPETRRECMELLKANGIEDFVDILGLVTGDDKVDLLMNTDIFVFPTYYPLEGHPAAIVEAMSAGCPVISTEHAAIPETVIDGETGILVEKQNPQALADAIARLMEDPELRVRMGKAGHKRYKQLYTHEKNIENMTRVFERALAE